MTEQIVALDALIEAMWAERQSEAIRVGEAQWRMQEEEALLALLMVA